MNSTEDFENLKILFLHQRGFIVSKVGTVMIENYKTCMDSINEFK